MKGQFGSQLTKTKCTLKLSKVFLNMTEFFIPKLNVSTYTQSITETKRPILQVSSEDIKVVGSQILLQFKHGKTEA